MEGKRLTSYDGRIRMSKVRAYILKKYKVINVTEKAKN